MSFIAVIQSANQHFQHHYSSLHVTWSFTNQSNILTCCSRNISCHYYWWKQLCCFIFMWKRWYRKSKKLNLFEKNVFVHLKKCIIQKCLSKVSSKLSIIINSQNWSQLQSSKNKITWLRFVWVLWRLWFIVYKKYYSAFSYCSKYILSW